MIELTLEQHEAVATSAERPLLVIDPNTDTKYVLLLEDVYNRVRRVFEQDEDDHFVNDLTPQVMEVFGREGWDDPAMDVYNDLDPRKSP